MKKLFLSILFLGLFSTSIFAGAKLDSGNFTVSYQEPTTSVDGTVLTDLDKTSIYYQIDSGTRILVMDIPASSVNGDGVINQSFTIDGLGNQVNITLIYTATDISGNESGEFIEPVIRIDQVAPNIPIG